jgi:crotonobetainyl-CoA:carnitine CoA-transferase CaiB-like acyl-CoA transferase
MNLFPGNTVTYSSLENTVRTAPPMLGGHTAEVLREELDISAGELEELEREGVISCS